METKSKVYLETTIPSVLTALPSRDIIAAGEQEITRNWWTCLKDRFELYVSELVIEEAMKGDADEAQRRLRVVKGLPLLEIDEETIQLTDIILETGIIPARAAADAAHIAIAARHAVDYLLTWNCRHLANAEIIRQISFHVSEAGFLLPIICTPLELSGGYYDG